ncbi:MAG: hypothetical protein QG635_781, partial [Bacteroidota bacterium]|nr:hypothetical protein [Bacteroidota bacterium]
KYENEYIEIHGFDIQYPGFYNDITINCG